MGPLRGTDGPGLLRLLPAPGPDDLARAPELGTTSAQTFQTATLLAPAWAPLADAYTGWPAWAKMIGWFSRYGGLAPWAGRRFKQLLMPRNARGLYHNGLSTQRPSTHPRYRWRLPMRFPRGSASASRAGRPACGHLQSPAAVLMTVRWGPAVVLRPGRPA